MPQTAVHKFLKQILPIILITVFAEVSRRFVEDPPYPVSPSNHYLTLIIALHAWFFLSYSLQLKSYGKFACGVAFGFLALCNGLLPDLWIRWPMATLTGLVLSQMGAVIVFYGLKKHPGLRLEAGFIIMVVSLAPLAILPYLAWPTKIGVLKYVVPFALLIPTAYFTWIRQKQRLSSMGLFSAGSLLLFSVILYLSSLFGYFNQTANRILFEEILLYYFVVFGAIYLSRQLDVKHDQNNFNRINLDISMKDTLTNIANRRAMKLHGTNLITRSLQSGRAVSIILADIDHFKNINDNYGHLIGDAVLRDTAQILSAQVRKSDLVVRYGGEEFLIILPGAKLAPALRLAEKMRTVTEQQSISVEETVLHRTLSFGVSTAFPEEPLTLNELIKRADTNLYRAKRSGRNRVMADPPPE